MGSCCQYEVVEKKMFLFEKKRTEFKFEENLYLQKNDVEIQNDILKMHLVLKEYDAENNYFAKDTILSVLLK